MALTPDEVVNKTFQPTKFREGYDQDEVDDFLDDVVGELRRLLAENQDLRTKLAECESGTSGTSGTSSTSGTSASVTTLKKAPPPPAEAPTQEPAAAAAAATPAPAREPAPVSAGAPEAATGVLALAQRLHDEHVRSGQEQHDRLVTEAQEQADQIVSAAEERKAQTLGSLEQERTLLERKIDELRSFERDYRTRLKSYLETQLKDLEAKAAVVPGGADGSAGRV